MGVRESAGVDVDAESGAVFDLVTSVPRLPEWNPGITEVVLDAPPSISTTFWRKHLLIKLRRPALRKETQDSLAALGSTVEG